MENTRKDSLNNVHNIRSAGAGRDFSCWLCIIDNSNCKKYKIKTPPCLANYRCFY